MKKFQEVIKKYYNKKLKPKLFFVLLLVLCKFVLDISYVYIISPKYQGEGFYTNLDMFKIIESYCILFICGLMIRHKIEKPSDFFILFLFSMLVIPLLSIYSLQDKSREFLYMVLISIFIIGVVSRLSRIKIPIPKLKYGDKIAIAICIFTGIFLFGWIIMNDGLDYLNFNINKVYNYRRIIAEKIFSGKLSYIMPWFGKVMNPLLIAYFLWKKNNKMVIITNIVQVLYYGFTAHRSMLFYPILILFVYLFRKSKYLGELIPFCLVGVVVLSSIYYIISNNLILTSLFVRRTLFLTALNHFRYYDTFKEIGFLYFSYKSWFPKIIEYPFDYPVPQVISQIYYGHTNTWVNTGFLANGYINLGFWGMIVYSIIVGIIFKYIDHLADECLPKWVCLAIMIVPMFNLINSDLLTSLLTHGILLAMIMLWLISSTYSNNELK